MVWIRFEDNFPEHPKVLALSSPAFRLHVVAIAHCSRHLTDGAVSLATAKALSGGRVARLTSELVKARLWKVADEGWVIHDYLHYQPSRTQVEDKRKERAAAGKQGARVTNLRRWRRQTVDKPSSS